ncbi:unnamed protein product [Caenorhabditis angaria]|uniref:Uncharacterized protein n=1 Tax=Caenorhabditis angaria TaxID=860376 RepID=A0A9P1MT23_9PELO|nr:unnamed protein product [Caenorhabditis angaria]
MLNENFNKFNNDNDYAPQNPGQHQYSSTLIKRICSPMLSLASTQWKTRHKQHEKQLYGEGNETIRNIYEIFHF